MPYPTPNRAVLIAAIQDAAGDPNAAAALVGDLYDAYIDLLAAHRAAAHALYETGDFGSPPVDVAGAVRHSVGRRRDALDELAARHAALVAFVSEIVALGEPGNTAARARVSLESIVTSAVAALRTTGQPR